MRCVICGSPDPDIDDGRCMDCISAAIAHREALYPAGDCADAPTESCPCAPTPAPGAERPALKAGDEVWVRGKVTDSRPLSSGAIVVAMSDSSGDDDGVVFVRPEDVREALAAAPPAPEEEEPMPCERCQENAETVWVPTGFSGEREPLCGKCISLMLDEGHASAERVREMEQAIQAINEEYLAYLHGPERYPTVGLINAIGCAEALARRALPPSTGEKSQ